MIPESSIISSFDGINWADARDNFVDGWIIPSGINHNAILSEVASQSREIITQFKNLLGINTIRLGINPPTVGDKEWWPKYRRIIKEALSLDMNVILACWEGKNNRNGRIDDKAEFDMMWDKVLDDFKNEPHVYFEIFNEPYGYSDQEWRDLASAWIDRQKSKIKDQDLSRILVSGTGYSENLISIASDSRFDGCFLSFHLYTWFCGKHRTVAEWQEEIEKRIGKSNSNRTIVTEWGAPMKNRPQDHYTKHLMDRNRECAYMTAMSNTIREWNMGSIYWPGLRDGDHFSLTERQGHGMKLKVTNESGRILLQWSFNLK
jgi:endoglucanase